LFGPQHVFGDSVAVEELNELLLLGGQLTQAAGMALALVRATWARFSMVVRTASRRVRFSSTVSQSSAWTVSSRSSMRSSRT